MFIPEIKIKDYTYTLPEEKIAKYPLSKRSDSKLLIFNKEITETTFSNIVDYLPKESLVVFNNTKVIQARLVFTKETGAKIEIFCLEPIEPSDINIAFQAKNTSTWKCIVGNSKKWKEGLLQQELTINNSRTIVKISRVDRKEDAQIIKFEWNSENISFGDILDAFGYTPIPPYLNRNSEEIDTKRYQTVYSQHKGSVAAPTAGLHFTDDIIKNLKNKGISTSNVTLHVGAGTFKPVKSETINEHEMHIEHFFVEKKTLLSILSHQGKITSTGTTSVRTLESIYWLGVKEIEQKNELYINQWDAYNLPQNYTLEESIKRLIDYMDNNNLNILESWTGILIAPGYNFKVVNQLITNFHQPNSTLLLLIAAFTKKDNWKKIYNYALNNKFRFLSYGDSSLLFRS